MQLPVLIGDKPMERGKQQALSRSDFVLRRTQDIGDNINWGSRYFFIVGGFFRIVKLTDFNHLFIFFIRFLLFYTECKTNT